MTNTYLEKCSTSLAFGEMHTKTVLRFHLSPGRIPIVKKAMTKNVKGGKRNPIHFWLVRVQTSMATMETSMEDPQQTEN